MKVLASILAVSHGQYNSTYDDYGQNSTAYYDYESGRMSTAINYPYIAATIDELAMPPIKCWHCENARNGRDCRKKGYLKQCESNEQVCEIEVRKRNGKRVESVSTGCKWRRACLDNKRQNFINPDKWQHQCRPGFWHHEKNKGPSVCRQCCTINKWTGQPDEECGLKFIEEFKGKAPPQKPRWREQLIDREFVCTIDGEEDKLTITTLTDVVPNADTDRQQEFMLVSDNQDCNFDWVVLDHDDENNFEKGKTDVFEFDFKDILNKPHCFQDIKGIKFKNGDCKGDECNEWKPDTIDVSFQKGDECKTKLYRFDWDIFGDLWIDDTETTLQLFYDAKKREDNHWILKVI